MIGNALLLALTLFMASGFLLMDRLKFLIPYRQVIFHDYGWAIGLYAALLFANLFAVFFLLARRFFLKHTGRMPHPCASFAQGWDSTVMFRLGFSSSWLPTFGSLWITATRWSSAGFHFCNLTSDFCNQGTSVH
jgi:hypothetical protein